MIPIGLVVSVSAAIEHHSVVCTLRVSFHRVLCCGEIIGLHGCVDAAVGSVAVILWLLAEGLAHRLTLGVKVMPIDLRTLVFVCVVIRWVWIKVGFILVYKRRQWSSASGYFPHWQKPIFLNHPAATYHFMGNRSWLNWPLLSPLRWRAVLQIETLSWHCDQVYLEQRTMCCPSAPHVIWVCC